MKDDLKEAYGWAINLKNRNRENPDLMAIIAVIIQLLNLDGTKYKVAASGEVST
jgi:hypothetical protein